MTLTESRKIKFLFEESNGVLTEGIFDKIKDSIKNKFSKKDVEEIKQSLSDNLGIDENSSIEEIEEKLREETGGKDNFNILKKVLRHVAGFGAMVLTWEIQAMIGAGIIKYFNGSPIAFAAVIIYLLYTMSDEWEKIRRKTLGKKVDQFIFGKRGHLGDFENQKNKDENDKEMNESRKKVIRLTESQLIGVIKKVISEQSEHVKNLYKSWANKKSGNPEEALKLMDDVFKYQKRLSKKDFSQYSSYEELKKDIDKLKQETKSTDATKLYEDSDLLVLAANTWEASCKYGAGSKWCTTAEDTASHWNRHNQTGTEFFWIFKNKPQDDPNHKFSYHVKLNGEPDWCNAVNYCLRDERLSQNSYPKQHPKYNEIVAKLQEFHNNRRFELNAKKEADIREYEIRTNLMPFVQSLLDNEITNVIPRQYLFNIVDENFDNVLNGYLENTFEDSLYMFIEDPNDLSEDELDDIKNQLYNNIQRLKDSLINDSLPDIYPEFSKGLSWSISNRLIRNYGFNNETPFEQQMREQNLTIVGLANTIKNETPEEIIEIVTETMSVFFIPEFEDELSYLIPY